MTKHKSVKQWYLFAILTVMAAVLIAMATRGGQPLANAETHTAANTPTRRVNVPYLEVVPPDPFSTKPAIFWLGQVNNTNNYADVRTIYDDNELRVTVHIMDRQLWYDTSPSIDQLTEWDAVTLYLNLDGAVGQNPGTNAYRFVAQLNHWQPRDNYQAVYRGDSSDWMPAALPFETTATWRGIALNNSDQDDRGWFARFIIPFASLGVSSPPSQSTTWDWP